MVNQFGFRQAKKIEIPLSAKTFFPDGESHIFSVSDANGIISIKKKIVVDSSKTIMTTQTLCFENDLLKLFQNWMFQDIVKR